MTSTDSRSRAALARLLIESVTGATGPLPPLVAANPLDLALEAAGEHRIAPAVYRRLRGLTETPDGWLCAFAAVRHLQLMRHLRTTAEIAGISRVMAAARIDWLVAKGPVAADVIWPSPDMREYHDLDIFVAGASFENALTAILDAGGRLVDRNWPELEGTGRAEIALVGPLGTPIDLHWHIAVPQRLRAVFSLDMPAMFGRARDVRLSSGLRVRTFDQVDTALHLAFHAAQAGAARLMWSGDLFYASRAAGFDPAELAARAQAAGVTRPIALMLDRVGRSLGLDFPLPQQFAGPADDAWARFVRGGGSVRHFPALPGDLHTGGNLYSGTRRSIPASITATIAASLQTRRLERRINRRGPVARSLHRDVPDESARARFFAAAAEER